MEREALKLALEAQSYAAACLLNQLSTKDKHAYAVEKLSASTAAIEKTLAQPAQEPDCQATGVCVRSGLYAPPLPVQPERQPNRVNFEKWLRNRWTDGYACPKKDGKYTDEVAQAFWECWQAAHNIGGATK